MRPLSKALTVIACTSANAVAFDAQACTRVLWNNNGFAVMVGRTMDWPESTQPTLVVLPRGVPRDGGKAGSETVVSERDWR